MVVRWVHRSSFTISPPAPNKPVRIPPMLNVGPGPSHGSWLVDPGWYGRVVVEAEGTNEGLASRPVSFVVMMPSCTYIVHGLKLENKKKKRTRASRICKHGADVRSRFVLLVRGLAARKWRRKGTWCSGS